MDKMLRNFIKSFVLMLLLTSAYLENINTHNTSSTKGTTVMSANNASCAAYSIQSINNNSVEEIADCKFPSLFSTQTRKCEPFADVNCGNRSEPVTPCEYPNSNCTRPQGNNESLCICERYPDLNYDMCRKLTNGDHVWPARHWSPFYIQCTSQRTLPTRCYGHSVIYNFFQNKCQVVYEVVNAAYSLSLSLDIPESLYHLISFQPTPFIHKTFEEISPTNFEPVVTTDVEILTTPTVLETVRDIKSALDTASSTLLYGESSNTIRVSSATPPLSDLKLISTYMTRFDSRINTMEISTGLFASSLRIYSDNLFEPLSLISESPSLVSDFTFMSSFISTASPPLQTTMETYNEVKPETSKVNTNKNNTDVPMQSVKEKPDITPTPSSSFSAFLNTAENMYSYRTHRDSVSLPVIDSSEIVFSSDDFYHFAIPAVSQTDLVFSPFGRQEMLLSSEHKNFISESSLPSPPDSLLPLTSTSLSALHPSSSPLSSPISSLLPSSFSSTPCSTFQSITPSISSKLVSLPSVYLQPSNPYFASTDFSSVVFLSSHLSIHNSVQLSNYLSSLIQPLSNFETEESSLFKQKPSVSIYGSTSTQVFGSKFSNTKSRSKLKPVSTTLHVSVSELSTDVRLMSKALSTTSNVYVLNSSSESISPSKTLSTASHISTKESVAVKSFFSNKLSETSTLYSNIQTENIVSCTSNNLLMEPSSLLVQNVMSPFREESSSIKPSPTHAEMKTKKTVISSRRSSILKPSITVPSGIISSESSSLLNSSRNVTNENVPVGSSNILNPSAVVSNGNVSRGSHSIMNQSTVDSSKTVLIESLTLLTLSTSVFSILNSQAVVSTGSSSILNPTAADSSRSSIIMNPSAILSSESSTILNPSAVLSSKSSTIYNPSAILSSGSSSILNPSAVLSSESSSILNPTAVLNPSKIDSSKPVLSESSSLLASSILKPSTSVSSGRFSILNPSILFSIESSSMLTPSIIFTSGYSSKPPRQAFPTTHTQAGKSAEIQKNNVTSIAIGVGVGGGVVLICLILLIVTIVLRKKKKRGRRDFFQVRLPPELFMTRSL